MKNRCDRSYTGNWFLVDWPFSRLLSVKRRVNGDVFVSLFDVDCDDAMRILSMGEPAVIHGSPFRIIEAQMRDAHCMHIRACYPNSRSDVEYVFNSPRGGSMCAECHWDEEYVNCDAMSSEKCGPKIVGVWRYAMLNYSSLIMTVRHGKDKRLHLEVKDSVDGRHLRSRTCRFSDDSVSLRLVETGLRYILMAKDSHNAICHCVNPHETWKRFGGGLTIRINGNNTKNGFRYTRLEGSI